MEIQRIYYILISCVFLNVKIEQPIQKVSVYISLLIQLRNCWVHPCI